MIDAFVQHQGNKIEIDWEKSTKISKIVVISNIAVFGERQKNKSWNIQMELIKYFCFKISKLLNMLFQFLKENADKSKKIQNTNQLEGKAIYKM